MKTIYEDTDVQRETEKLDELKRQAADLKSQLETLRQTPVTERNQRQADRLLSGQEIVFEDQDLARRLQVTELAVRTQGNRLYEAKQSAGKRLWTEVESQGQQLRYETRKALTDLREAVLRERGFFDRTLPLMGLTQDLNCVRSSGPCRELCQIVGPLDDGPGQDASPMGRWMSWYKGG